MGESQGLGFVSQGVSAVVSVVREMMGLVDDAQDRKEGLEEALVESNFCIHVSSTCTLFSDKRGA